MLNTMARLAAGGQDHSAAPHNSVQLSDSLAELNAGHDKLRVVEPLHWRRL
jgi:hypothetical protein